MACKFLQFFHIGFIIKNIALMKSISDINEKHICELKDWPEKLTQNIVQKNKEEMYERRVNVTWKTDTVIPTAF